MERILHNPILKGFYPDPSICRKDGDYYIAVSSFEYFPGIPIFHSRDLAHWHQIGYCLDRPSQLDLTGVPPAKGIYAPTIRYNEADGLFYVVTTLVRGSNYYENVNFYVTAADPAGPWSEPVIVKGAEGIDPTLYFEEGRAYYIGNMRLHPEDPSSRERNIWISGLDPATGELTGERTILLADGAVHGAASPEAPHIYRANGWYYLLIAEGGTAYNHAVSVFRSRELTGPYIINPRNPILTHRNILRSAPVNSTGHADLVRTPNGMWWAVLLGARPVGDYRYRNIGREAFLAPVAWEDDWPVISPDTGHIELTYPAPDLPCREWPEQPACDHFDCAPGLMWQSLRAPMGTYAGTASRPGCLTLRLSPDGLCGLGKPAFICRRQQHTRFAVRTAMEFRPEKEGEAAGIALLLNHENQLRVEYVMADGRRVLRAVSRAGGRDSVLNAADCDAMKLWLRVTADAQSACFYYAVSPEQWLPLAKNADLSILSKLEGGFTGTVIGMFATSNGRESGASANFAWFEYQPLE